MSILDWIYPPACMSCGQILPAQLKERRRFRLCAPCHALFNRIPPPVCGRCGYPLEEGREVTGAGEEARCPACFNREFAFKRNRSFFVYDGVLRDILLNVKFNGKREAVRGLGELWASVLTGDDGVDKDSVLVPVPMHPRKQRERGFNQAEILALALAEKTGVKMISDLLKRAVDTPPQSGLTARGRAENVRGVFGLNGGYNIEGIKIILADDIFTTGASLNACAQVCAAGGAGEVNCLTLAVAVKNKSVI